MTYLKWSLTTCLGGLLAFSLLHATRSVPLKSPTIAPHLANASGKLGNAKLQNAAEIASVAAGLQPVDRTRVVTTLGKAPLSFERNTGQTDPRVKFLSRGPGYSVFLTSSEGILSLAEESTTSDRKMFGSKFPDVRSPQLPKSTSLRMSLPGSNSAAEIVGLDELPGKVNYLVGRREKRRTNIPTYARVKYKSVYPGIDLVYYGNQKQLEYDFVVAPGADPKQIRLAFDGAKDLRIDDETGDLVIPTASGAELRQMRPRVYQQVGNHEVEVAGSYRIVDRSRAAFTLAAYDMRRPLIIDPTVAFTTFLAGSAEDVVTGVAADSSGNSYVTGWTVSSDFPRQNDGWLDRIAKSCYTAPSSKTLCSPQAFVTKLNSTGGIVFSTYIGGSGLDLPHGIAVNGDIYVAGFTSSTDFGEGYNRSFTYAYGGGNAFVAAISSNGESYSYVTAFGGVGLNDAYAIAVDSARAAYVTGITYSADFPTSKYFSQTLNPWQKAFGGDRDAFVVKVDPYGLFNTGYSTYIGGTGYDAGQGIAVDSKGYAYVTGVTASLDFPTIGMPSVGFPGGGGATAFVTKLLPNGSGAVYSVYLGGSETVSDPPPFDQGLAIAIDASGDAYVTGSTCSPNFPTTLGALQEGQPIACSSEIPAGPSSSFVTELSNAGKILASTYLGGNGATNGNSIAINQSGQIYVAGYTSGSRFLDTEIPFIPNPTAGFLAKLGPDLKSNTFINYLGAQINSIAVVQNGSRLSILNPTEVYTAGLRYRPGSDVTSVSNIDGFVVKLTDAAVQLQK
ncbi:MAG: SBBP repeat-containing protein [Bryobacteraceae bacterium]